MRNHTMASRITGVIMTLFGLPFVPIGIFFLQNGYNEWRDASRASQWTPTVAKLQYVTLESHAGRKSDQRTFEVRAFYTYELDGRVYESARVGVHEGSDSDQSWHQDRYNELKSALEAGGEITAYVNPTNPAESVLYREPRLPLLIFHFAFGGVFTLVGLGLFVGGLRRAFGGGAARRLRRQFPNEPWKWRKDWAAGVIKSENPKAARGLLMFAFFWLVVSLGSLMAMLSNDRDQALPAVLIVIVFIGIGIAMLGWAIRELRVAKRYGAAELHLASVPGVIGGKLAGVVKLPNYAEPYESYIVDLECERAVRRGKSTSLVKAWGAQLRIDPKKIPARKDGVQIPVLFGIPFGLPPSGPPISWTLRVRGKQPGVDVDLRFSVPVFQTAESRPDFKLDDTGIRPYLLAQPAP
jgi:hypothetical protein